MDISEEGIAQAQRLAKQTDLSDRARFIRCDVLELDAHLEQRFDVVFTSYGVLNWLSDLSRWATIVARHLKPGGRFFIAEIHPASGIFDNLRSDFALRYDYFHTPEPVVDQEPVPDYADPDYVSQTETHQWAWSLADIFDALWGAGLEITEFKEYPYSCYRQFPQMTQGADGFWHLPAGTPQIPLLFSLAAQHRQK